MTSYKRASRPIRNLLAVALVAAAAPAMAGGTYSQTVFFGDSLTDGGFFRPLLPLTVRPVTGQFTTNPGLVWSQYLADFYGTRADANGNGQTGTNYAAGGARVGINSTGALGPIPSLATQVNNYLTSTGGRADPRALYTVWGGANDIFAITNAGAPVVPTLPNAVASQIGIVGQLQTAGARYILVPTIPDLGLTPAFRAAGAAAQANGTALSINYNSALFAGLAGGNLRVIPVDTFNLLREIAANPGAYGFTNITGTACQPQITANSLTCNPTSYVTPTAAQDYLFADGVHPTSSAHRILSEYTVSILEAPRHISALSHSASVAGRARAEQVSLHLDGKPAGDGTRWWGGVRGDIQRYDDGALYDGLGPSIAGGVDWTRGNLVYGAFGGLGRNDTEFGNRFGDASQLDVTLGGFVGWYGDRAWVNGQLSYSHMSFDIDREIWLGPAKRSHEGSPNGKNLSLGVNAGYEFSGDRLSHGPVASLLAQRIDIDGYAEDQPALSTSLAFPDQSYDSMIGSLGWQVSYKINDHVAPYARLTYDREFEDADKEVFARAQSIPGSLPYAVPGLELDDNYATLIFGARTELFGLDANIGASTTLFQGKATDASVYANFGKGF
ncbi:MAG: autotransporter domain-containing protein [Lysobacteraceae bacterium]|nr:MAG: autotransporter domain-containing protein [Xanthomonadaceae bacterium]